GRTLKLPPRTASIAGMVIDETLAPIAGARVCADADSPTLEAELIREPRCTVTDARGAYVVRELYAANYAVAAMARPYRATHVPEFELADGEAKTGVDLQLRHKGAEVSGTVIDVTGGPIANALVRKGADPAVETDAQGRFTLWARPGRIELSASADGYADGEDLGTAPGTSEIVLTPESSISGIVVDASTRKPVPGVMVEAVAEHDHVATDVTGEDGRFRISRLGAERCALTARAEAGFGQSTSVLVGLSQHVTDVVIELHPAYRVIGKVMQPDGKVCRDSALTLRGRGAELAAQREPDGTLRVGGLAAGAYEVAITCTGFAAAAQYPTIRVIDRDVLGQTWRVDAGATLQGTVTTKAGTPIEGAQVSASSAAGTLDVWTDDDGRYAFTGIWPGKARIDIFTAEGLSVEEGYAVTIATGTTTRDFVLDTPGRIRGVVTDVAGVAQPGVDLDVLRDRGNDGGASVTWARTNDKGELEANGLYPGAYVVERRAVFGSDAPASDQVDTQVRGGQTSQVKLVIAPYTGKITGRVVDPDGKPVADAYVVSVAETGQGDRAALIARGAAQWLAGVVADVGGDFVLTKLAPGTHTVRAFRKGGGEALATGVKLGATITLRIQRTGSVAGRVTVEGKPTNDLEVQLTGGGLNREEVFLHSGGAYVIDELPPGRYKLHVYAERDDGGGEITIAEGERKQGVDFALAGTVTVSGRLVDGAGRPLARLEIQLWPNPSLRMTRDGESGADGRFTIEGAPRGEVEIVLEDRNSEHRYRVAKQGWQIAGAGLVDLGDIVVIEEK
ncbi:MAG TPA: carboxypeptidase-like regulatory domain-containing protein, partial [Kofleriaceae bacterium]